MIGRLPKSLAVNGREHAIRTDYRAVLAIFQAFADPDLSDREKCAVCLQCLYKDVSAIPKEDIQQAVEAAYDFIGGGREHEDEGHGAKLLDWEQDEALIFSAVNKAAGCEVRALPYCHWWTFLGYFNEIGEGLLSAVISIRGKRAKGKRLDKWEKEFYREHKGMIDIKRRLSAEETAAEQADAEFIKQLTGR